MPEIWKPIPDFPGYEVSDHGRVRSYRRRGNKPPLILRLTLSEGYPRVNLCRDGKSYRIRVHRLVLLVFVGPCPPGMESCHNDGIRTNIALTNLRWDTLSNNQLDRRKHGNLYCGPIGEKRWGAKLIDAQVIKMREMYTQGYGARKLSKAFGISTCQVWQIVNRRKWRHLL